KVNRRSEHKSEKCQEEQSFQPGHDREVAISEDRQRHQWRCLESLPDQKCSEHEEAPSYDLGNRHGGSAHSAPVIALSFDEAENNSEKAGAGKAHPDQIEGLPV